MLFVILEKYCKDALNKEPSVFLHVSRASYFSYKNKNILPLKCCKIISQHLGIEGTIDNEKRLVSGILEKYWGK